MDYNGNYLEGVGLQEGGKITGDLEIDANLSVSGNADFQTFTAVNGVITDTLQVNNLVSDIKTEDTLIHLGLNNPADNLNLGYLEEYNDGAVKFTGIVRDRVDKKHYIINNATPIPTGITDITSLARGDLVLRDLEGNIIISNTLESTFVKFFENTGNTIKFTMDVEEKGLGQPDVFTIRNEVGDVCMFINQVGNVITSVSQRLITPAGIEIYSGGIECKGGDIIADQSTSKVKALQYELLQSQIGGGGATTWNIRGDAAPYNFTIARDDVSAPLFEIEQVSGKINLLSNTDVSGDLVLKGNGNLIFESIDNTPRWTFLDGAGTFELNIRNQLSQPVLQLEQSGHVNMEYGNLNFIGNDRSIKFFDGLGAENYSIRYYDDNKSVSIDQGGSPLLEIVQTAVPVISKTTIDTNDTYVRNLYINSGLDQFKMPPDRGNFNEVLVSDGAGGTSWEVAGAGAGSLDWNLGVGGNANVASARYFRTWGEGNTASDNSIGPNNRGVINVNNTLRKISYSTTTGDTTTEMQILKNDVVEDTFLLLAPQGIHSTSIDFTTGDTITIGFSGTGTPPGNANFVCFFSTASLGGTTLQDVFNQSTEPQITTDLSNSRLVIKQGIGASNNVVQFQDQIGGNLLNVSYPYTQAPGLEASAFQILAKGGLQIGGLGVSDEYKFPVDNTQASNGDILKYDAATRELKFYTPPQLLYYYNQTNVATVVNNSGDNNVIITTNSKGSLVHPPNTFETGSRFRFSAKGRVKTDATVGRVLTMRLFWNSTQATIPFATSNLTLDQLNTFQEVFITFDVSIFQDGANGLTRSQSFGQYFDSGGNLQTDKFYDNGRDIDTTISNTILCIVTLSHTSPDFEFQANMLTLERLA